MVSVTLTATATTPTEISKLIRVLEQFDFTETEIANNVTLPARTDVVPVPPGLGPGPIPVAAQPIPIPIPITRDALRELVLAFFVERPGDAGTDMVRHLLAAYGVTAVRQLPDEKLTEFAEVLKNA